MLRRKYIDLETHSEKLMRNAFQRSTELCLHSLSTNACSSHVAKKRKKKPLVLYLTWSCVDLKCHKLAFLPVDMAAVLRVNIVVVNLESFDSGTAEWTEHQLWFLWSFNRSYRGESQANGPPKDGKSQTKSSCIWFARTGPMWQSMFSLFRSNFQLRVSI